jgi:hypothetical protein
MSNYHAAALVLDALILELIGKGIDIPGHATEELKAGRSLASIGMRQPGDADIDMKAMTALQNVEMNLLALAEAGFGAEYAEEWQKRINSAYQEKPVGTPPVTATKFISGIPKGKHWVRIKATELEAVPGYEKLLGVFSLSAVAQEEGWLLIHGRKEDVSAFLKSVREIIVSCQQNSAQNKKNADPS